EVSPLRASMRGLPPTTLFVGDYELFYPDVMELAQKMKQEGVSVNLDFQAGGMHVYPLIPSPEGNRALQVLKRDLLEVSERVTGIEPA
ncbi:MAG: alpha/beta hydrolase, partial [Aquiluna sp.]